MTQATDIERAREIADCALRAADIEPESQAALRVWQDTYDAALAALQQNAHASAEWKAFTEHWPFKFATPSGSHVSVRRKPGMIPIEETALCQPAPADDALVEEVADFIADRISIGFDSQADLEEIAAAAIEYAAAERARFDKLREAAARASIVLGHYKGEQAALAKEDIDEALADIEGDEE